MSIGASPLLQVWLLAFTSAFIGWGAAYVSRSERPMTGVFPWQLLVFLDVYCRSASLAYGSG